MMATSGAFPPRLVVGGDARLGLEGVQHLLERLLLDAAPQGGDGDRALGFPAAARVVVATAARRAGGHEQGHDQERDDDS
jgi:hypothetical protein